MERVIIFDLEEDFVRNLSYRLNQENSDILLEHHINKAQLKEAIFTYVDEYVFAIIDIDAYENCAKEIVDLLSKQYIPMLILTKQENVKYRDSIMRDYPIIDFGTKDNTKNFYYISNLINHMRNAEKLDILLVSNSTYDREFIHDNLLRRYPFDIIDANDKKDVANALEGNDKIKIIIIDIVPEDIGLEIVEEVRESHQKNELAIIVVTSSEYSYLAAKYLQVGANDFIMKPLLLETFHSRLNVVLETLSLFEKLQRVANVDFLTNLHNRRYFYEVGAMLFQNAKRKNIRLCTAIIDIDHFKKVNDTYGHAIGDVVLKEVARIIKTSFRSSDLHARLGGEEFSVIMIDAKENFIDNIFENLRQTIEKNVIKYDELEIKITISIGVTTVINENLVRTLEVADTNLYKAKDIGRNKIIITK